MYGHNVLELELILHFVTILLYFLYVQSKRSLSVKLRTKKSAATVKLDELK